MKKAVRLFVVILPFAFTYFAFAEDITVDKTVYKDYQVIRTQPDGIVIKHSSGIATLYFWELPADLQKKYNYDPVKAQAYNQKAKEQQAAWLAKMKEQSKLEQQKLDEANAILAQQIEAAKAQAAQPQQQKQNIPNQHLAGPVDLKVPTAWDPSGYGSFKK
jgi:tRNA A37 threonylcarbamoyladenosine modification protein TsaB